MQKTLGSGGSANYRKAMSCPESRAELVQLAIALEAARKWGRRRPRDDLIEGREIEMQAPQIRVEL